MSRKSEWTEDTAVLQGVFRAWPLCQPCELCRGLLWLLSGFWRFRLWVLDGLVLIAVDNKYLWGWSKLSWPWEIVMSSFCRNNTQGHVGIRNKKLTPSAPHPHSGITDIALSPSRWTSRCSVLLDIPGSRHHTALEFALRLVKYGWEM